MTTLRDRARTAPAPDEPATLTVRVPLAFRRRGARKALVAPDGAPLPLRPPRPAVDSPLVRALARAFRWRRLLETGVHATLADIARAEAINPSYASRVLRLTLLAPDLVEAILDGTLPAPSVDGLMKPFPVEWAGQQLIWGSD